LVVRRYLLYALLVTTLVLVLPAVVVWFLLPPVGAWQMLEAIVLTTAISIAIAKVLSLLWARRADSRDLIFADLTPWGLARRSRLEHRIEDASRVLGAEDAAQDLSREERVKTLEDLGAMLGARDAATLGHSRRVARHAEAIAKGMHLPTSLVAKIRVAAAIHDVGKINTPREILNKPGPLTTEEFEVVKRHADEGAKMVAALNDDEITAMVRSHHERLDGTGYPNQLAGDQIPIGAMIVAVADSFDAMTSNRAYRKKLSHEQALDILQEESGDKLNADAVSAFASYYSARRSVPVFALLSAVPVRAIAWLLSPANGSLSVGTTFGGSALAVGAAAVAIGTPVSGPLQQHSRALARPAIEVKSDSQDRVPNKSKGQPAKTKPTTTPAPGRATGSATITVASHLPVTTPQTVTPPTVTTPKLPLPSVDPPKPAVVVGNLTCGLPGLTPQLKALLHCP
jgi:putative nucleotidyltransferase with HDIG domain